MFKITSILYFKVLKDSEIFASFMECMINKETINSESYKKKMIRKFERIPLAVISM
jgi:hypothetical protein